MKNAIPLLALLLAGAAVFAPAVSAGLRPVRQLWNCNGEEIRPDEFANCVCGKQEGTKLPDASQDAKCEQWYQAYKAGNQCRLKEDADINGVITPQVDPPQRPPLCPPATS